MYVHFFAKPFSLWDYKLPRHADSFTLPMCLLFRMATCTLAGATPLLMLQLIHLHGWKEQLGHSCFLLEWLPLSRACSPFSKVETTLWVWSLIEQDMMLVCRLIDSKFYICKITMFLLLSFQLPFPLPDALFLPFPSPPFPIDPLSFLPLFPSTLRWSPNHAMGVSISSWTICRRLVWKWHGWRKTALSSTNRQWKTILRWCACDLAKEIMCFSL